MSVQGQDFVNKRAVSLETMRQAIKNQAPLVPGALAHVTPQVRAIVKQLDLKRATNVFTTGCGDSLYVAMATRFAFEKYSGLRTEAIEALEFSRYTVDYIPPASLVVSISAGGNKSRPTEALRRAQRFGATTVAVTGERQTPFSQAGNYMILQNEYEYRVTPPEGEGTFKLGNYLASMISMYVLALEIGLTKGVISRSDYDTAVAQILRAADIIPPTIQANQATISEYATRVANAPAHYILGGGPSYATALFTAAKMFELPQLHGVPIELEEWAHEQYFLTRSGTPVLVIMPPGRSLDRAREQILGAKDLDAHVVAVCDAQDHETRELADQTFPILGEVAEEFTPLTYCIPGQLLALELSRALGKPAFKFINALQYEVNRRQITASRMRGLDD